MSERKRTPDDIVPPSSRPCSYSDEAKSPPFAAARADGAPSAAEPATAAAAADQYGDAPRSEVDFLVDMGFSRGQAAQAVMCSDGTKRGAVDWIVEREREREGQGAGSQTPSREASAATSAGIGVANMTASAKATAASSTGIPSTLGASPKKPKKKAMTLTIEEPSFPSDPFSLPSSTETAGKKTEVTHSSGREDRQFDAEASAFQSSGARVGAGGHRVEAEGPLRRVIAASAFGRGVTNRASNPLDQPGAHQVAGRTASNRAEVTSDEADTVMTPVAHAVVVASPEEDAGVASGSSGSAGGAGSVVLATAAPSTIRSRWLKIAVAVLSACVVGIGLAFGLSSRGQQDQSQASSKGGMSLPDFASPLATTAWPPSTTSLEQSANSTVFATNESSTNPTTTMTTASTPASTTTMTPTTTRTHTTTTATTTTKRSTTTATTTTARAQELKNTICAGLLSTCDDLSTEGTPQSKALQWVISDSSYESFAPWRRIQRYVLAVVAFSLDGWGGVDTDGSDIVDWRDGGEEECSWKWGPARWEKIKCDSSERVTDIGFHEDLLATGNVPRDVALLSSSLEYLYFYGVGFSGSIPTELGMLSELEYLGLYTNKLEGAIPSELGLLTKIEMLDLYTNKLEGVIPSELGLLTKLEYLDLFNNKLEGSIPSELGLLTSLEKLSLWENKLEGSIPSELGLLTNLKYLELVDNELEGSIPSELGRLTNLETLLLSNNKLEGGIPSELGHLTSLKMLWLGTNDLTGSMPAEVCALRTPDSHLGSLAAGCKEEVECAKPGCCTSCY